jgi:LCP family protein required for cell wall assembly
VIPPPRRDEPDDHRSPEQHASDETAEYELGEDFLTDLDAAEDAEAAEAGGADAAEAEEAEAEEGEEEHEAELADEVAEEELDEELDEAEPVGEHEEGGEELPAGEPHDEEGEELPADEAPGEEGELEELIDAETQEWEGIDAAEDGHGEAPAEVAEPRAEADGAGADGAGDQEPTLVAAAGARVGEGLEKARRWRPGFPLWLRFTTASLLIIASVATATAASLILYLGDVAKALRDPTGVLQGADKFLTNVDGGAPQTILILGSDKDPELKDQLKGFKGLSDTTMLLRLDPDRNAIALFSLPRDLKVNIPGRGVAKLNEAYAYGGPQLTLQTVEELLSQGGNTFEVNHLVNVDFEGFARAVNALDCVYVDVDRRYFNSNEGKPDALAYEEIDLQPGYQALCGFDALDYARYRHTDNDIVRAARQQEFLREARQKIPPERLFADRRELIKIFTTHTTSDINDPQTMLQVLKLFLEARDAPIKQVKFEGNIGPSFVTASTGQLQKAVRQFLGFQATPGRAGQTALPDEPVEQETPPDAVPVAPAGGKKAKKNREREPTAAPATEDGFNLIETELGKQLAKPVRYRAAKLTIYYPTLLENGTDYAQKPRVYKINGTGEGSPPRGERTAYKWVFSRPALGEYYGFTGTRWKDPPILQEADETRTIGDRDYQLYYDGDRLRIVAWKDDLGSYWVSNTLIESLSNREMLKLAQGFKKLPRVAEGGER